MASYDSEGVELDRMVRDYYYCCAPLSLTFSVERQKAEYLKNIFTNVYIKDVVERNRHEIRWWEIALIMTFSKAAKTVGFC